jgi:hypothetical protein
LEAVTLRGQVRPLLVVLLGPVTSAGQVRPLTCHTFGTCQPHRTGQVCQSSSRRYLSASKERLDAPTCQSIEECFLLCSAFERGEDIDYVFNDSDVAGANDKPDNMNIDDKMMR